MSSLTTITISLHNIITTMNIFLSKNFPLHFLSFPPQLVCVCPLLFLSASKLCLPFVPLREPIKNGLFVGNMEENEMRKKPSHSWYGLTSSSLYLYFYIFLSLSQEIELVTARARAFWNPSIQFSIPFNFFQEQKAIAHNKIRLINGNLQQEEEDDEDTCAGRVRDGERGGPEVAGAVAPFEPLNWII